MPTSKVTDHNAVDQDQAAMETALGANPVKYDVATAVYSSGGYSKSRADFTLAIPLTSSYSKGDVVTGLNADGAVIGGFVYMDHAAGATTLRVGYATSDIQATYMDCKVGGLETPVTTGCFADGQSITVAGDVLAVTGAIANSNGRTLQGFSSGAESKMYNGCIGCPYKDFMMYYDYYGDFTYADKWVSAALAGTATAFTSGRGDADFAAINDDATRVDAAKKGSAYMNVWMYVMREFEDAIDDCGAGCIACNYGAAHAWDEGVAFYTGSREGFDGEGSGKMVYALADKRCGNYKTCGLAGNSTSGMAKVNSELSDLFALGQHKLLVGQCEAVRPIVNQISTQMTIPLIQGTMRYAYKVEFLSGGLKEASEGAVFAAAVLPRLHFCSAVDAQTVYNNIGLGATTTVFADVKAAFENNYACLNITCEDVGGLWFSGNDTYYDGFSPCVTPVPSATTTATADVAGSDSDSDAISDSALTYIILGVVAAVIFLLATVFLIYKEKNGKPVFYTVHNNIGNSDTDGATMGF